MRVVAALLMLGLLSAPTEAKSRRAPHKKPAPRVHVVPNNSAAEEYAREEAQLKELRSAHELAPPPEAPIQGLQEHDSEVPPGLKNAR
jgi:hypothetical protein